MKKAVILHGTMGSPSGNWFEWLQDDLANRSIEAWLPNLPDSEKPSLIKWLNFVREECPFEIDEQTIIIGHSSGGVLALVLAQKSKQKIGAVVAVSSFPDNSLGWDANDNLFDIAFNFQAIAVNSESLIMIHSDNDPYVPLAKAQYLASQCRTELIVWPGQGHFNLEQSPDYSKFPRLTDYLENNSIIHEPYPPICVVDEHDHPLEAKLLLEVYNKGLIHRIVIIAVYDQEGKLLLQKRSQNVMNFPGLWDISAAGHVDEGEEYETAAKRELGEELGLNGMTLDKVGHDRADIEHNGNLLRRFAAYYRLIVPVGQKIVFQQEEISQTQWFTKQEIQTIFKQNPSDIVSDVRRTLKKYYGYEDN